MEFTVKSGSPEKQRTACLVLGIFEPRKFSQTAEIIDDISNGFLANIIRRGDMEGRIGQTLLLHNVPNVLADRILLVGCDRERDFDAEAFRQVLEHSALALSNSGSTECVSYLSDLAVRGRDYPWKIRYAVQATENSLYRFEQLKSFKDLPRRPLRKMIFTVPNRRDLTMAEEALRQGLAVASAIRLTRDLVNLPANICTPAYMAEQARAIAKTYPSLQLQIYDEAALQQLKMSAFLAMASRQPTEPLLIRLSHQPAEAINSQPIVFIGQGITFNARILYQEGQVAHSKIQMAGAATLLGVMQAVAELALPIQIIAYLPCAEYSHDNRNLQVGNILATHSGFNVEITQANAEGQLMLCDILSHAAADQPEYIIDIATLSRGCMESIGSYTHCLLGNSNPLINDLLSAGRTAEDRAWELPLLEEFSRDLVSNFADFATHHPDHPENVVLFVAFLHRFVNKNRWAHLDISGSAWLNSQDVQESNHQGASGRPVALLMQYLFDYIQYELSKNDKNKEED